MWDDDYDYKWTLIDANHYYETSSYEAKKNQEDPKQGKYKVVSHGYLKHGGEKSQWMVVRYHHYDISMSKQMSFKGVGDNIASLVWKIRKQEFLEFPLVR
jgi:hypothetical protein